MYEKFQQTAIEMDLKDPPEKAIYVKLTPGTPLFNQVCKVAERIGESPTQAARRLMGVGWIGFLRAIRYDLKGEKE